METNDSNPNIKPQSTGGLKLMTVFIAVLVLHVLVIGGFAISHLMSGGPSDSDVTSDKSHAKSDSLVAGDGQLPAATSTDKAPSDTTPAAPVAVTPPSPVVTPAAIPTSTTTVASSSTAEPTTTIMAPTADTPSGPVHSPVVNMTPAPSTSSSTLVMDDPAPAAEPLTSAGPVSGPYVVKSGDSLARIAHQHHTSVAKLKAANTLTSDMLHIGQKLTLPGQTQVAATSAVAPVKSAKLAKPALTASTTAPTAMTTASTHHLYTVVKGDTLTKIAHKFKTTPSAIMTANSLTDATKLSIGKKLKIPSAEARSAATAQPAAPEAAPLEPKTTKPAGQLANFVP